MRLPRSLRVLFKRLSYGGIGASADGARVVEWLEIEDGMKIADIGSGFGDFAFRMARASGPSGVVYAVDTDEDLREEVARRARERGLTNVRPVAAGADSPGIPEPVDVVFLSSSFHHLPDQQRYFGNLRARLKPAGRVVILEGKPGMLTGLFGHSTQPGNVVATMESAGYRRARSSEMIRWASLQSFEPETRPG